MSHTKKLTLLHSNDLHGDFLAAELDTRLIGGVSMLSGYVNKVRQEEENTIYCIAGEMFRGSVIDSAFRICCSLKNVRNSPLSMRICMFPPMVPACLSPIILSKWTE